MITEAERLLIRLGIDDVERLTPLKPGLGGTELWRAQRSAGDVVLRAFAPGAPAVSAEREAAAHRLVREHGVAAPAVLACEVVEERPVLLMEWCDGELVAEALLRDGGTATELGHRCGSLLAALHLITDLPPVVGDRDWLDWAGARAAELAPLRRLHSATALLHLDFHPQNLIISPAGTLTVLDWANVRAGPPRADLARTLSIIELIMDVVVATDRERAIIADFRDALLDGYAAAGGDPDVPDPLRAWAYAVQVDDLAGSWVPADHLERLRRRYLALRPRTG